MKKAKAKKAVKKRAARKKVRLWLGRSGGSYLLWAGINPPVFQDQYWTQPRGCHLLRTLCPKDVFRYCPKSWRLKPGGGPLIVTLGEARMVRP